jgi:uncharacterized membrane protein
MATLTVWKLDSANGADEAVAVVKRLQQQQLLQLEDAAVISWSSNAKKPTIRQLHELVGPGALGGAFWGLLFGLLFFVPLLGAAIGAGIGALVASTADVGIDDKLIKDLRSKITPGTSALFLLTSNAVTDRLGDELSAFRGHAELIESNLSREDEARLHEIFARATPVTETAPASRPVTPPPPTEQAASPTSVTPISEPARAETPPTESTAGTDHEPPEEKAAA